MNKLFTKPDTIVTQARSVQRISKPVKTQSELISLAQACKAHYEKQGVTHYAKLSSGKVLKSSADKLPCQNFVRSWNSQ
jgi:predicted transcriptional regulator